jgi:hypothetical protein
MTGSETIDVAFRMFQVLGWTFLRLSAGPTLLCMAALAFLNQFVLPGFFETSHADQWLYQIGEVGVALFLGLAVGGPLFLIGVASVTASVTQLVSDYMVGNVPDERAAQGAMVRCLPKLVLLSLREMLLSTGGILLLLGILIVSAVLSKVLPQVEAVSGIVFGIALLALLPAGLVFLYVRINHALAPTILVLEGAGLRDAGRRSRFLIATPDFQGAGQGTIMSLSMVCGFVVLMLAGGLYLFAGTLGLREQLQQVALNFPVPGLVLQAYDMLPLFLSLWVVLPLWAATTTILYYDRRIRLEGYDIEALAGDVWRAEKQNRFQL